MQHGKRMRVAILGATGIVGQRFVQLLDGHPWFEVTALAASAQSADKRYGDVVKWKLPGAPPEWAAKMTVVECRPGLAYGDLAFSALDAKTAEYVEPEFTRNQYVVVSNASAFRADPLVPLVIPEVNANHLSLVRHQRRRKGTLGFMVTNPNCNVAGIALALAPLHAAFGVKSVVATTMQAASGAGYPGVASLDLMDNLLPNIEGEAPKIVSETKKILGKLVGSTILRADIAISAQCNRVAVVDGHTASLEVALDKKATARQIIAAWENWRLSSFQLPTSADQPIVYNPAPDRPQPRLDRDAGRGMTVTIGQLAPTEVLGWQFVLSVHNTIRGAGGGGVGIAELLYASGMLDEYAR